MVKNHDLDYAFSTDLGTTWKNNWGQKIADLQEKQPIVPVYAGITVFGIPKFGYVVSLGTVEYS